MGWKQIYPKDCYRRMLVLSGEGDISFPKVVNILVREGLIRLGEIPEDTSLAYLLKPRDFVLNDPHLEAIEKQLINILRNWDEIIKPEAKNFWIKKAKQFKQLPAAQRILEKAQGEG